MQSLSSEQKSIARDILEDILSAIERLEERTKDVHSIDDFLNSSEGMILLDATCMLLIAIGESLKSLDKTTEGQLLPMYPSIPWKNVKGMRDILRAMLSRGRILPTPCCLWTTTWSLNTRRQLPGVDSARSMARKPIQVSMTSGPQRAAPESTTSTATASLNLSAV